MDLCDIYRMLNDLGYLMNMQLNSRCVDLQMKTKNKEYMEFVVDKIYTFKDN